MLRHGFVAAALIAGSFITLASLASAKAPSTAPVAAGMTEAAEKFLASLNADEIKKATMAFDDPKRMDWHNIPKPERKGLQFKEMNPEQRKLCLALIKTALSDVGYDKALKIMSLEQNLLIGEKGKGPLRDPERYFLTVFGKPATSGEWGWSFEGHHFSLNFVVRDGSVVADTPMFLGANPAMVHTFVEGGPAVGTRTLAKEEQTALDLVGSLDEGQLKMALIAETAPKDYRNAGVPTPPQGAPEGIAYADLNGDQQKLLWSLLETNCNNLAPEVAATRLDELESAGRERIFFAWAGATKPGVGHYFRVQGPTFVLELVNIQSDPAGNPANHIHSVWRDLKGDFGVAIK